MLMATANLTNMSNFTILKFWDIYKYKYNAYLLVIDRRSWPVEVDPSKLTRRSWPVKVDPVVEVHPVVEVDPVVVEVDLL